MNPTPKKSMIEKSINWIIDARGDSYGDERERLRYYEAHSAMLTVQTYLLPLVAAAVIAVAGKSSIAPVLVLTFVPLFLASMGLAYLKRQNVSLATNTFRKPLRSVVYLLSYMTLPLAIFYQESTSPSVFIGMATGLVMSALIMIRRVRREAKS